MSKINFFLARLTDEDFSHHLKDALNDASTHIKEQKLSLEELKQLIITLTILKNIAHSALYHSDRGINVIEIHTLDAYFSENLVVSYETNRPEQKGGSACFDIHYSEAYIT
jgi:hypothetical protein